jgi:4-hydroxy-3-polyprenylbenzoate decarboxylase
MEDAWIGKATERIFLSPIRLTMIPELTDMDLPFAGVAHNISIVKIRKSYPGQAVKVMHSLWGAGQMMFNKILIATDDRTDERFQVSGSRFQVSEQKSAIPNPQSEIIDIHDYSAIARLFRENFDPSRSLHFSKGPLDILDHSSRKYAYGSKLGIDLTRAFPEEQNNNHPDPSGAIPAFSPELLKQTDHIYGFKNLSEEINLPVLLLSVDKSDSFSRSGLIEKLAGMPGMEHFKAVILFDKFAGLDDLFTLIWLLGGNLDPKRDVLLLRSQGGHEYVLADATFKTMKHDDFDREWPNIVTMDDPTIAAVDKKWQELNLGQFLPSPSSNLKKLVIGVGAIARV